MGKESEKEYIYHCAVHLKLTWDCKSTTLKKNPTDWRKKKKKKKKGHDLQVADVTSVPISLNTT